MSGNNTNDRYNSPRGRGRGGRGGGGSWRGRGGRGGGRGGDSFGRGYIDADDSANGGNRGRYFVGLGSQSGAQGGPRRSFSPSTSGALRIRPGDMYRPPNQNASYTRLRSQYSVPVMFIKSAEVYDPSKFVNDFIKSHHSHVSTHPSETTESITTIPSSPVNDLVESSIGISAVESQAAAMENLVIDDVEIVDPPVPEDELESKSDDKSKSDDDSDSDLDNDALAKWAMRDIGGEGRGLDYELSSPEDSDDDDDDDNEDDNDILSYNQTIIVKADLTNLRAVHTDSEDSYNFFYMDASTNNEYFPITYSDLVSKHTNIKFPPLTKLVSTIMSKGRYISSLEHRVTDFETEKSELDQLGKDQRESVLKYKSATPSLSSSANLAELVGSLSQMQDSKRNKSARKLAREGLESIAQLESPNYNATKKSMKGKINYAAADPSLHEDLEDQFERARKNQALKKIERKLQRDLAKSQMKNDRNQERDRVKGDLQAIRAERAAKYNGSNGYINLTIKYPVYMKVRDVAHEIEYFLLLKGARKSLPFPKMGIPGDMEKVVEIAAFYNLETKVKGKDKSLHITVIKGPQLLLNADHDQIYNYLTQYGDYKLWSTDETINPNLIKEKKFAKLKVRAEKQKVLVQQSTKIKDGHVVGQSAIAIDSSNRGHQLLTMMGWSTGTGLGKTRTGISEPLLATVKMTRTGLGNV